MKNVYSRLLNYSSGGMMMVVWTTVSRIIFEYMCKVELIGFAGGIGM